MNIASLLLHAIVEQGGEAQALLRLQKDLVKVRTTVPLSSGDALLLYPQKEAPHRLRLRIVSLLPSRELERLQALLKQYDLQMEERLLPLLKLLMEYKVPLTREKIKNFTEFIQGNDQITEQQLHIYVFFLKARLKMSHEEVARHARWITEDIDQAAVQSFLKGAKSDLLPFFFPWLNAEYKARCLFRWDDNPGSAAQGRTFRLWVKLKNEKICVLGFWKKPKLYLYMAVEKKPTQIMLEENKHLLQERLKLWKIVLAMFVIARKKPLNFLEFMLEREPAALPAVLAVG